MYNWLRLSAIVLLFASSAAVSGCGLIAAGAAGAVVADEVQEEDGKFDPLENTEVGQEVYE